MARYFTRSRAGEIPADAHGLQFVNGQPLPPGAAHAHASSLGLLEDGETTALVTDPTNDLEEWEMVEVEADPAGAIVPNADEVRTGVFVVPLVELARVPLMPWIEERARAGSAKDQDAASILLTLAEVSRNP